MNVRFFSENMSEKMPNNMLEYISEKMSEHMSEHMSEQGPECIWRNARIYHRKLMSHCSRDHPKQSNLFCTTPWQIFSCSATIDITLPLLHHDCNVCHLSLSKVSIGPTILDTEDFPEGTACWAQLSGKH